MLHKKAEGFAKSLGHNNFIVNNGWLEKFRTVPCNKSF